jgi:hypothetical protein
MKHLRVVLISVALVVLVVACAQDRKRSEPAAPTATTTTSQAATTRSTTKASTTTAAASKPAPRPPVAKWSMRELPKDEVNLIVFGDYANNKDSQRVVAKGMAEYVERVGTQFNAVLTVGDNFYVRLNGVSDDQFQSLFEYMYDAKRINFPFFLSMGNHDYEPAQPDRSRGEKYKWEIEMEYAKKHPDSRLKFPSRWHRADFPQGSEHPLLTTLLLESNKPHMTPQMWEEQKRWIDQQLSSSTARWKITCAHHPLFSNGSHGDNGVMQVEWGPILRKNGVDLYCGGHDHDLQHLQVPGWPMSFIQAGGGGQTITDMRWDSRGPFSRKVHGFVHLRIMRDRAELRYIDAKEVKIAHFFTREKDGTVTVIHTTGRDRATTKPLKTLLGIPESATKPATTRATTRASR